MLLSETERRSLKTARTRFHDVYVRLNCIANDHPEYNRLHVLADSLLLCIERIEKEGLNYECT